MIVCFSITAALLFIVFKVTTMLNAPTSEANTYEFRGTLNRIEKDRKNYFIYVEEYDCKFMLPMASILDYSDLSQLDKGDVVYLRIFDSAQNFLNNPTVNQLAIVTFKTSEKEIATFNSYNKVEERRMITMKIVGVLFSVVFSLIGIYCILKLHGVKFSKRKLEPK